MKNTKTIATLSHIARKNALKNIERDDDFIAWYDNLKREIADEILTLDERIYDVDVFPYELEATAYLYDGYSVITDDAGELACKMRAIMERYYCHDPRYAWAHDEKVLFNSRGDIVAYA